MVVLKDTRLVRRPTNQSCDKCREVGVVCFEGLSTACQRYHAHKVACSVAGDCSGLRRKGTLTAATVPPRGKYFLS